MPNLVFIRKNIALSRKTKSDFSRWGTGLNLVVEVGFAWTSEFQEARVRQTMARVLGEIDHAALGVDRWLDRDATLENICHWIFEGLQVHGAREVCLIGGDGMSALLRATH